MIIINKKTAEKIAGEIDEEETLIQQYINELIQIDIKAETEDIKREDLMNQWFAPYPSYIPVSGKYTYPCQQTTNITLECQNSISVNMETGEVSSSLGDQITFANLVIPNMDGTLKIVPQEEQGQVDVLLIPTINGFDSMIMQTPLGASTFTKTIYLNGFGTKHFELFDNVQSMTGTKVMTWKVKWDVEEELLTIDDLGSIGVGDIEFEIEDDSNSTKILIFKYGCNSF